MTLEAGAARTVITPPLGSRLAGFPGRAQGADRVRDDVHVRALVVRSSGETLCVISLDVMAVDQGWAGELRAAISRTRGIPVSNVLIAATHTHSSTAGLLSFQGDVGELLGCLFFETSGPEEPELRAALTADVLSCVDEAFADLRPAVAGLGRAELRGIAANRVDVSLPVDHECTVLVFRTPEGALRSVVAHFTCHPTTLGNTDLAVSGDFPGIASSRLEASLGTEVVVPFLNGALGDVSTRYTRRGHGYPEAERFAAELARGVEEATNAVTEWHSTLALSGETAEIDLPLKQPSPEDGRALARLEELRSGNSGLDHSAGRELAVAEQAAEIRAQLTAALSETRRDSVTWPVQILTIGPLIHLVAIPGEPFSSLAMRIRERCTPVPVLVVAPANGYLGYLPDSAAYAGNGYEASACIVAPGAGETLADAAAGLLGAGR